MTRVDDHRVLIGLPKGDGSIDPYVAALAHAQIRARLRAMQGAQTTPVRSHHIGRESATTTIANDPPRRGRLLVIDDEESLCRSLVFFFETEHEVHAEVQAVAALARIQRGERFDVILCDLMMPGMSGIDLYRQLMRIHPPSAERMVFLTGGAFTPQSQAFLDEVANDCLEKPYSLDTLRSLVNAKLAAYPSADLVT